MKRPASGCFGGSVLCFAFLAAVPALAQAPDHADKLETSNSETGATFRSKVTLVTVPVVVRDRRGKAVGNLQEEDFQLFDRGRQQTISKFAIEKADVSDTNPEGLPSAGGPESGAKLWQPIASQFVAYVFDDLHLDAANLSVLRPAAEKHLTGLTPTARGDFYYFGRHDARFHQRPGQAPRCFILACDPSQTARTSATTWRTSF